MHNFTINNLYVVQSVIKQYFMESVYGNY